MNKDQVKDVISEARTKYWLSESVGQSFSHYNKTVANPIEETQKVLTENYSSELTYMPIGANRISDEKVKEWDIQNENFLM